MPAITSLPYTISSPGCYWLDSYLSVSMATGAAITVAASFVTIEFRGHSITKSNGSSNLASLITNSGSPSGVVIEGPNTYGFFRGINLAADRCIVRNGNIHAWFRPIVMSGRSNLVENNHLTGGGCTATGYKDSHVFGVEMSGPGSIVRGNTIPNLARVGFDPTDGEIGAISFSDDCAGSFSVDNLASIEEPMVRSFGNWIGGTSRAICKGNALINFNVGIGYSSPPDGEIKNNTVVGATTDYLLSDGDVQDGGGNT